MPGGSQPQMFPPFALPLHVPSTGLRCRDQARGSQCGGTRRHRTRPRSSQKRLLVQTVSPETERPTGSIFWGAETSENQGTVESTRTWQLEQACQVEVVPQVEGSLGITTFRGEGRSQLGLSPAFQCTGRGDGAGEVGRSQGTGGLIFTLHRRL